MSTPVRWIVAAAAIVLVACLLIWARGEDHQRGDDVGAHGSVETVVGL
ncbi:MAG: hypothetical protein K0Q93_2340 [Nocardioidaceae bacterium]|jgi:hypothetical protein|nr:hypothetical protein [Nocardioidaceae bacterium]